MKYAIVSDIHANESAFRAVVDDARRRGADAFVSLGDAVGYGPLPAETLALVRGTCAVVLAGNHDDAVSGRGDASAFIDLAGDAVDRHRAALSSDDLAWLRGLPYTAELEGGAVATHGDLTDPPRFYYIETEGDAAANFGATGSPLVFVGHTHVPCVFLTGRSGKVYRIDPQDFTLEPGKRYIVNPGSVGYPREDGGRCRSSYVIYDTDEGTVTFHFLPFSVASVLQRGKAAKRIPKRLLAVLALALAALVATAACLLTPKTVEVTDDPALVVETKTLPLAPDLRGVRANLQLEKGSAPVALKVVFTGADGAGSAPQVFPVKRSSSARLDIPAGAAEAVFTVLRVRPGDKPAIAAFAPSATTK